MSMKLQLTVKAGKVTKFCGKYALSEYYKPGKVMLGDRIVDANGMEVLRVKGNSMRDYGIRSGNQVFVKIYHTEDEKESIKTYPVMVINIRNHRRCDSIYKLRKFVSYVDLNAVDWSKVYNNSHNRIKVTEQEFVERCITKSQKDNVRGLNRCILSETYNEDKALYEYSLHPITELYAKVCYVK